MGEGLSQEALEGYTATMENSMEGPQKIKIRTTI